MMSNVLNILHFFFDFLKISVIIMARIKSQRKFGLPRGRNLPFTLESRKGNYQILLAQKGGFPVGNKIAERNGPENRISYQQVLK